MLNPQAPAFRQPDVPREHALAWDTTDAAMEKLKSHMQGLPDLMRTLHDLQKTLEQTRVAYNQAVTQRDEDRERLVAAEGHLSDVQRVVQRYAGVTEPVVASDGYTYERSVIRKYLDDCKSSSTDACSQQTNEVLTENFVPNQSLKKLVDTLKMVRGNEVPAAQKASIIPPFRHSGDDEKKKHTSMPSGNTVTPADHDHKSDNRGVEKRGKEDASRGGKAPGLHPCLRVYGYCNFKDDCTFAKFPYDACLNNIKGKCRFGDQCKELHVNLKDQRFSNPSAKNGPQSGPGPRDGKDMKDTHKEAAKEMPKEPRTAASIVAGPPKKK